MIEIALTLAIIAEMGAIGWQAIRAFSAPVDTQEEQETRDFLAWVREESNKKGIKP